MTADQLKSALTAKPFSPVVLKTTGGREYRVEHQELVSFSPGGRVINLWVGHDSGVWIDVLTIESVHRENGETGGLRRTA